MSIEISFSIDLKTDAEDPDYKSYDLFLVPKSGAAKEMFGDCVIGQMSFLYDKTTSVWLNNKYNIGKIIVLELVHRNTLCDKNKRVGILNALMCNLSNFDFINVDNIYLFAISFKLVEVYKKYGFESIDPSDPRHMVAPPTKIKEFCSKINSKPVIG
jgi:hypothetical protein